MLHKHYVVLVVALVSALALCLGVTSSVSARASAKGAPVVGPTTYSDPVNWLAALGVIDTAHFDPAANLTRAQFAQMLYVFTRGEDDGAVAFVDKHTRFTDIQGHWAEGYVKYLTHIHVVNDGPRNGSTLFQPDSPITGYEMLRMVALLIGSPSLRVCQPVTGSSIPFTLPCQGVLPRPTRLYGLMARQRAKRRQWSSRTRWTFPSTTQLIARPTSTSASTPRPSSPLAGPTRTRTATTSG
jgi:hypothetical protein